MFKSFIILYSIIFCSTIYAGDFAAVGEPVMSPGLNAYVYEPGEKMYKVLFNTGVMSASYVNANGLGNTHKSYMIMGGTFLFNPFYIFDFGIYANFALAGKDENIMTTGAELRMHLVPVWMLELFYFKIGMGRLRYNRGNSIASGMEIPWGGGIEIATCKNTVINFEYIRRPLYFFSTSPSVWNLMFSIGYAW